MNGIIYSITNKINNKKYVGQTTIGLKVRYSLNWWKNSHNQYLKHSIEKYGIDNFEFEILKDNINSIEKLNELEGIYANELNSYIPNGYNIRKCGNNKLWNDESKEKLSKSLSKQFKLKNATTGEIVIIDRLKEFCKINNLNKSAIQNLIYGISDYSQGFVRENTDPNTTKNGKMYTFISPSGEIIKGSVNYMSKNFDIKRHGLYHLISGQCKTYYGWSIIKDMS